MVVLPKARGCTSGLLRSAQCLTKRAWESAAGVEGEPGGMEEVRDLSKVVERVGGKAWNSSHVWTARQGKLWGLERTHVETLRHGWTTAVLRAGRTARSACDLWCLVTLALLGRNSLGNQPVPASFLLQLELSLPR